MPNPYHDAAGRFCSGPEMLASINDLARRGEVEAFMKLRGEYETIRRDIRFGRLNAPDEYDTELQRFLAPPTSYPSYPLPDGKLLPFSRVRRGLNASGVVNQQLAQLDNEGRVLRDSLSKLELGTLNIYGGMGSTHVNAYLREGDEGLRSYLANHGSPVDEEELDEYRELAESATAKLDAIFAKHPRLETNRRALHRMIEVKGQTPLAFAQSRYPVGATVTEASYLSTSIDSDNVLLHSAAREEASLVFEIISADGLTLHRSDGLRGRPGTYEREVLLNRNSKFTVLSHGEATYESTHLDGRPDESRYRHAKKRQRYTVIQMRHEA